MNVSIQVEVQCPVCGGKTSYSSNDDYHKPEVYIECNRRCWKGPYKPTISDAIYFGRIEAAKQSSSRSILNPIKVYTENELNSKNIS